MNILATDNLMFYFYIQKRLYKIFCTDVLIFYEYFSYGDWYI